MKQQNIQQNTPMTRTAMKQQNIQQNTPMTRTAMKQLAMKWTIPQHHTETTNINQQNTPMTRINTIMNQQNIQNTQTSDTIVMNHLTQSMKWITTRKHTEMITMNPLNTRMTKDTIAMNQ